MKEDIHTTITDKIVSYLERGQRPWLLPWSDDNAEGKVTLPAREDGTPYKGINTLMLWARRLEEGYGYNQWMTARQAEKLGGQVIEEEAAKGTSVGYQTAFKKTATNEQTGEVTENSIPFMKAYKVYNVEQIKDLPSGYYTLDHTYPLSPDERVEAAERFIENIPAEIRHGGTKSFYTAGKDYIQMPHIDAFKNAEGYYGTLLNEIMHWTRHPSRLDRSFDKDKYGMNTHAMEQLVAEIGTSMLAARLGTVPMLNKDSIGSIDSFIKLLKDDKRAIFKAAALAQKAVDFVQKLQLPDPQPEAAPRQERQTVRNHNKGGNLVLG